MSKSLRICLIPQITIKKFLSDSGWAWAMTRAKAFSSMGHTCFVFVPLTTGITTDDKLPELPGVFYENIDGISTFYSTHPDISTIIRRVHPRIGEIIPHIILTSQVCTASVFAGLQGDCNPHDGYGIILHDTYGTSPHDTLTKGQFTATNIKGGSDYSLAEFRPLSYPAVQRLIFSTPLEKQHGIEGARRMLSASVLKSLDKITYIQPGGVDLERIEKLSKGVKKHPEFTLFFGGRLNSVKRPELMIKAYVRYIALGNPPNVVITSPKQDGDFYDTLSPDMKKFIVFKPKVKSDDFIKEAAKCHAIVYPSRAEGFAIGVCELIMTGIVMIFPDLPWVKAIFNESLKGFPYLFKDRKDINGMLNMINEDYKSAQKAMKPLQDYVKNNYEYMKCAERLNGIVGGLNESLTDYYVKDKLSPVAKLFLETAESMPEKFSLTELIKFTVDGSKVLKENYFNSINPLSRRYPSKLGIIRLIQGQGIAELVQDKNIIFKKLPKTEATNESVI